MRQIISVVNMHEKTNQISACDSSPSVWELKLMFADLTLIKVFIAVIEP